MDKKRTDEQKKRKQFSLYQKEQLVICATVLCFVVSGIGLPTIRTKFFSQSSNTISSTPNMESKTDTLSKEQTVSPESNQQNHDTAVQSPVPDAPEDNTDVVTPPADNANKQNPSADRKNPNTNNADTPEKEWVPPVYKTVHHPAITETRKYYFCSGAIDESGKICNIRFNSLEEWAAHKKINGG